MSAELQDAEALAEEFAKPNAIWRHECPFAGDGEIDEHCPAILDCRCFEGPRFYAAQDAMAVKLDLERGSKE